MSLNWREIALIIEELPLEGSLIQRVHQIGFHALVWELHHPQTGFWQLYVEIGTPEARMHRITGSPGTYRRKKTLKLQRFIQYLRAHVEGGKIISASLPTHDRIVVWKIQRGGQILQIVLRFFSGPGANVFVCDESLLIRESFFRRPKRDEISGKQLSIIEVPYTAFPIRPYPTEQTFNTFIEQTYTESAESDLDHLIAQVEQIRDAQIDRIKSELRTASETVKHQADFETFRISGDLLSASAHLIKSQQKWIEVPDFTSENHVTIELDPSRTVGENIAAYYRQYQKRKVSYEMAVARVTELSEQLDQITRHYAQLLDREELNLAELRKELKQEQQGKIPPSSPYAQAPGLQFTSSIFTLLVGRNAKENDQLLRRWAKGNDWWLHTRDVPGGYVIIKGKSGKSIPLETLLDAGNLALLFSKAKEARKADLYVTQVKYLKRPKGGKAGLVLPTQEKNITIELDDDRIKKLFAQQQSGEQPWTT
jgi:predicted ribosome quality control (RQC) complex YloA/Tae2 family protein